MPPIPGSRYRSRRPRPLATDQHVEQRRVDVARAEHDALDVGIGEHVGGVGVVGQPQIGQPGLAGLAGGADEPDDTTPASGWVWNRLTEVDRPAVGADDDHPALEVAHLALGRQPRAVDGAPSDEGDRCPTRSR